MMASLSTHVLDTSHANQRLRSVLRAFTWIFRKAWRWCNDTSCSRHPKFVAGATSKLDANAAARTSPLASLG